jgi:signal-transduction protein with cAMP-binding, CBS, and nucleotidyltransferase domain
MIVREAMSSPIFAVEEGSDITEVAKLMRQQKLGAIVVNNSEGQPVGIVTERDIVLRVVAEGKSPHGVPAGDVMSSPLRVVKAETPIIDAMSMMDKLNIRRLGVTYKGQLVGIISHKDIIRIIPTIMEIMRENSKINAETTNTGPSTVGYCDRCETYSTNLRSVDGEFLCEDCRAEEKEE